MLGSYGIYPKGPCTYRVYAWAFKGSHVVVKGPSILGGSWYLVTKSECTYNSYNHVVGALKGLSTWVISTVIFGY